jgi:F-type H+-transporting ATPase subunit b
MQINLAPDYTLLMVMAIFIVNYFVVKRFLITPVNRVIEDRETEVRSADTLYEQALTRFNDATASIEERLQQTRKEGAAVREKLRNEAAQHRSAVLERTRGEAEKIVAEADASLRADVDAARQAIVRDSESLARLTAERILGRKIS